MFTVTSVFILDFNLVTRVVLISLFVLFVCTFQFFIVKLRVNLKTKRKLPNVELFLNPILSAVSFRLPCLC